MCLFRLTACRYLGHCIGYAVVASVLLDAVVVRHVSVVSPAAARRAALEHTVVRLREGFGRRGPGSSSSTSEGRTSSIVPSSCVVAEQGGTVTESLGHPQARPSCEPACSGATCQQGGDVHSINEVGAGFGLQNLQTCENSATSGEASVTNQDAPDSNNISFSGSNRLPEALHNLELSSPSVPLTDQQAFDANLALLFQERLNDPRFTSMLQQNPEFVAQCGGEQELTTLLQDKGLDPNFAMMLKEKGVDPTILALLQRSSLDAGRDPAEIAEGSTTGSKRLEVLPADEAVSWSEELQRQQWGKWSRRVVKCFVGTPERAWVFFSMIFVVECVVVAVFRPTLVTVINARHEQVRVYLSFFKSAPDHME